MTVRPAIIALIVLATALAGCTTPGVGEDDPHDDPKPGRPVAAFSPAVRVGPNVGEPGLQVGADGTVWVHWPGGMHESADGGATWNEVDFGPQNVIVGGDADLAIGADGALYYTDLEALAAISVFRSTDGGSTWIGNPIASNVPVVDRQWILAGPDASRSMQESVYLVFNQLQTGIKVMKSTTGGIVYESAALVQTEQSCYRGNVAVSKTDGTFYIADCDDNGPRLYVSEDGARAFTDRRVATRQGYDGILFPVVAVDDAGTVYAVWAERAGNGADVFAAVSADKGATWSEPTRVNPEGTTAIMPWAVAGSKGRLGIAYYYSTTRATPDDMPEDAEWFVGYAVATDAASGSPTFVRSRVSDDVIQRGFICLQGLSCSERFGGSGGRNLLDFFQVQTDAAGRAHVVWADGCDECSSAASSRDARVTYAVQTTGPMLQD